MAKKKVELFVAFEFICDECGRNSYVSGIRVSSDMLREEALERAGVESELELTEEEQQALENFCESSVLTQTPAEVKCLHCGTEYDIANPLPNDDIAGYAIDDYEEIFEDSLEDPDEDEDDAADAWKRGRIDDDEDD